MANVELSTITDVFIPLAQKAANSGVASLDSSGDVPDGQIAASIARVSDVTTSLALKANLASPTFTGTPAAPTAAGGTNTTQIATTAFVTTAVAAVSAGDLSVYRPKVEPVNGDFAWVNQGSATLDTTDGLFLACPVEASNSIRMRMKTIPASPFTITVFAEFQLAAADFQTAFPIILRQSSTSELIVFGWLHNASFGIFLSQKDNETTDNSNYVVGHTSFSTAPRIPNYWRLVADGSNYTWSVSYGGRRFTQIHQAAKTDFLTADQVGFGAASINASNAAGVHIVSWEEQ
jgi:hypothetical protein